jgi:hypothetical protein
MLITRLRIAVAYCGHALPPQLDTISCYQKLLLLAAVRLPYAAPVLPIWFRFQVAVDTVIWAG